MTAEDEAKKDSPSVPRLFPKLSISTKGLLSGSAVGATPGRTTSKRSIFATTPSTVYISSPLSMMDLTPLKTNLNKFLSPSQTFSRLREEKDELSRITPSPASHSFRDGFSLPLIGEVKPKVLLEFAKKWLRNPKNLALLFWGFAVGVSGAILFMVMVGMLNAAIPNRSQRNTWFEVSNQIINALFTLMCVYLHPQRCLHLQMLRRWNASDIVKMREVYCKHGTRKPHEWGHMLVVVLLLQLNCFAQYALCGLNWGYRRAQRPAIGVAVCLCLSLGGAAGAGIYNSVSPLGRDFDDESDSDEEMQKEGSHGTNDQESQFAPRTKLYRMLERRKSFTCRTGHSVVEKPTWRGGLFDIKSDPPVSVLSTICCVCVFGWNMDRLGFGNRYVHIVTFILICTAPFWIFDLAALNIQNKYVRNSIGGAGIALCAFGLLYGGYWRIRMRERFKLPENHFCCGKSSCTDCFQWLFCPICSLCQETRTAEYYDVKDDKFYSRSRRIDHTPMMGTPRTPAPTLSAVYEGSESFENSSRFKNPQAMPQNGLDSSSGETYDTKNAMVPPPQVTMAGADPSIFSTPESPTRNSTSAVPLLQPQMFTSDTGPPAPEAYHNPLTSTGFATDEDQLLQSAHNPFYPPQFCSPPKRTFSKSSSLEDDVQIPLPNISSSPNSPLLLQAEKFDSKEMAARTTSA